MLALHVTELDLTDFSKPEMFQILAVTSLFFTSLHLVP